MEPTLKTPVVVDLGKSNRKRIKKLKRGEGKLMSKLQDELAQLKVTGKIPENAETIVCVVERSTTLSRSQLPMSKCFS